MKKKLLSTLLAFIFILSLIPSAVFAAGPKSITGIEVTKAPSAVEGTHGYYVNAFDSDTGEYLGGYYEYDIDPLEVKISFADGTTKTVTSQYDCYQATGYYWNAASDQSASAPWGAGYHTANVTIGSYSTSYFVTVTPGPIDALIIGDIVLIEGVDGYEETEYNSSTGDYETYFRYDLFSWDARVRLADGTEEEIYSGYYDNVNDEWGDLFFGSDQSVRSPWGVGLHKAKGYLFGKECEFSVTVIPDPIESVEFHDVTLYEGINTYTSYYGQTMYYYDYDFTIHFKDGTSLRSINGGVTYNGKYYYAYGDDGQYENPWSPGEMHYVAVTVAGRSEYQRVEIKANPYCDLTMYEDENLDLYLRFWKNSYIYDDYKVTGFVQSGNIYRGEDENGLLDAVIYFGGNPVFVKFHYAHDPSGIPYYDQDLWIKFGDFVSDSHFDILWLKKVIMLPRYAGYTYTQPYFDPSFTSFSRTSYDLDTVITLACNIRGMFDKFESMGWDGEYSYAFFEKREIVEAVQYVFGIDIEDEIQNYKYYGSPEWESSIRVNSSSRTDYLTDIGFDPAQDASGYRYMTPVYEKPDASQETIKFKLDGDLTINTINFGAEEPFMLGDVNGDGDVTMKDVLKIRRYIAGLDDLTPEEFERADVNGDGDVTMKDVLKIRRYIAGIDTEM
jgi:hypothetical protein